MTTFSITRPIALPQISGTVLASADVDTSGVPAWVPASGTVADLTSISLNTAVGRTVNWWKVWSTVAWAPWYGTHGSIIAAGGGHNDGSENDIARLDVDTATFSMIKTPPATSYVKVASSNNADDSGDGWMYANTTAGDFTMQTGESPAQHYYGALLAVPDNAISGGGGNGWLFQAGQFVIPTNGNPGSNMAHKLRLGVDQLYTTHGTASHQHGLNGTCYDSSRGRVWYPVQVGSDPSNTWGYRVLSDQSAGTQVMAGGIEWQNNYDSQTYSPSLDCIIRVKTGLDIDVIDLATNTAYRPTQTGTPPSAPHDKYAARWSETWGCVYLLRGEGDNVVYFCKPTGNPRTGTWAWSSQTITTGSIRATEANSAHGRVIHIESAGNVLVWCADARYPVQVIGVTPP